jgi:hypothetical protein
MRALYACLVPSPRSLPALLPQLTTWEDHLWVRINMLIQEKINEELDNLTDSFWLNDVDKAPPARQILPLRTPTTGQHEEWDAEIRKILAEMESLKVEGYVLTPGDYSQFLITILLARVYSIRSTLLNSALLLAEWMLCFRGSQKPSKMVTYETCPNSAFILSFICVPNF